MKIAVIFLMVITLFGCKSVKPLNEKLYEIQKQAVLNSPYSSAIGATAYVNAQREFRLYKLPKQLKSVIFTRADESDTVIISESYNDACINCPCDRINVLFRDTIYSATEEILDHKGHIVYRTEISPFDTSSKYPDYRLKYSELIEMSSKVTKGKPWTTNPLQYGSDHCNDGDHTIITVIYPSKKMEALYVRCWDPLFYRNKK